MGQKQFEEFQSHVGMLSAEQLKQIQIKIEAKLERKESPLVNQDELDFISSLFN